MKNNTFILFLLITTAFSNVIVGQTKTYQNYTITIPTGWKESTKTELKDFNDLTSQSYDLMLYPSQKANYNGPPTILSIFKQKEMSKSEFEKIANDLLKTLPSTLHNFVPSEFSSDVKMLTPGRGYYDKKGAFFTYMYEADLKNVGKIYTILTCFYTPAGLLSVQFSDYSSKYINTVNGYIQLVKSIKK